MNWRQTLSEEEQRAVYDCEEVVAKLAMMLDNALTRVEQLEQEYHICPMCGKAHPMVDTPLPMPQSDWTFERVMNDCPYRRRQDG
jgi:gamma-glutamyl:cysteine ligase YbdK (ATP-grasp superfamily)